MAQRSKLPHERGCRGAWAMLGALLILAGCGQKGPLVAPADSPWGPGEPPWTGLATRPAPKPLPPLAASATQPSEPSASASVPAR